MVKKMTKKEQMRSNKKQFTIVERGKNIDDCGDRTHEPEGSGPKPDAFDHFAKSSYGCVAPLSTRWHIISSKFYLMNIDPNPNPTPVNVTMLALLKYELQPGTCSFALLNFVSRLRPSRGFLAICQCEALTILCNT